MNFTKCKNIFSLILILVHFATMVMTIGTHNHLFAGATQSLPSIVSHNCGAKEMHRGIETEDYCLPCFRSYNSVTNFEFCSFLSDIAIERPHAEYVNSFPNSETLSYTPDRGPPSYHNAV